MRKNSSSIRIRTLAAAAALALSVVPVALATPATADVGVAAASCTGNSTMTRHGLRFTLPSVGNNTGNLNCHLGRGNQSVAVSNLQAHLNLCYWSGSTMSGHRSVFSSRLATDGIFGDRTRNAVIAVQGHHRISADGSYGPQTRGVMFFAADNGGAGVCRQYGA